MTEITVTTSTFLDSLWAATAVMLPLLALVIVVVLAVRLARR